MSEAELWSLSVLLPVHRGSSGYQPRVGFTMETPWRAVNSRLLFTCAVSGLEVVSHPLPFELPGH